jgi:hypothetical protein
MTLPERMKFKIESPEHSEAIQKGCFDGDVLLCPTSMHLYIEKSRRSVQSNKSPSYFEQCKAVICSIVKGQIIEGDHGPWDGIMPGEVMPEISLEEAKELAGCQDSPETGEWVLWLGGECPVPTKTVVDVKLKYDGGALTRRTLASRVNWNWFDDGPSSVIAYRVVKEEQKPPIGIHEAAIMKKNYEDDKLKELGLDPADGWILWEGGKCPTKDKNTVVDIKVESIKEIITGYARNINWNAGVVAYRVAPFLSKQEEDEIRRMGIEQLRKGAEKIEEATKMQNMVNDMQASISQRPAYCTCDNSVAMCSACARRLHALNEELSDAKQLSSHPGVSFGAIDPSIAEPKWHEAYRLAKQGKPHPNRNPHADMIHEWAETGRKVEWSDDDGCNWYGMDDMEIPSWLPDCKYRWADEQPKSDMRVVLSPTGYRIIFG